METERPSASYVVDVSERYQGRKLLAEEVC